MTEDEKQQVAVFRFGVISDFVNGSQLNRAQRRQLLADKCSRKWRIPFSSKTRLSQQSPTELTKEMIEDYLLNLDTVSPGRLLVNISQYHRQAYAEIKAISCD